MTTVYYSARGRRKWGTQRVCFHLSQNCGNGVNVSEWVTLETTGLPEFSAEYPSYRPFWVPDYSGEAYLCMDCQRRALRGATT